MKSIFFLVMAINAILLCGCTENEEAEITETITETSATTFNEYILTRRWNGDELLESIFYCGEFHPLPMNVEDYSEFVLLDGILYLPDNYRAIATTDENGAITALEFTISSAPYDFSIYGINFNSRPSDIQEQIGFANSITGDEDTTIVFEFSGGGINRLIFEFTERQLTSVYISA